MSRERFRRVWLNIAILRRRVPALEAPLEELVLICDTCQRTDAGLSLALAVWRDVVARRAEELCRAGRASQGHDQIGYVEEGEIISVR